MDQKTYVEGFHNKNAVKKMKYSSLGTTGLMLSEIGFGGGPIGGEYGNFNLDEAIEAVRKALSSGINYIDTAPWYGAGKSEERLGKALKNIPRSSYYIATKVGRYEKDIHKMFDFSAEKVTAGFDESLSKLGLDYVDIIQIHDIEFCSNIDIIINETLPAVQKIVDSGKARFIGITGYPLRILKEVYERSPVKISSILSYCRNTLFDEELKLYIPFFQEKGVGVINACAFAMGLLVNQGPQPWHPAPEIIRNACLNARNYCMEQNTNIATLALKYSLLTEGVTTHLLGIHNHEELQNNLDAAQTPLSPFEEKLIAELKTSFCSKLKETHWEDVEVNKYRNALKGI